MLGREVRLAEQHDDERAGMPAAEFGNLVGGVAVTGANFAQIFARHAIKAIDGCAVVAGGGEQFVKRSPVVSPVEFETDALAQFVFGNLGAEPFVENMLVAGKNGFDSQHYGALVEFRIAEDRGEIALRVGQGVVVSDQNDSSVGDLVADIAGGENLLVGAVSLAKVAEIFASGGGINGANLTLDAGGGGALGGTAQRWQHPGGCHKFVVGRWSLVVRYSLFRIRASL